MKGITPVISLIMLMLITVGIVGVSYAWFSGLATSSIQKSIAIPPGGAYCSDGDMKVFILNNGDTDITASDIVVAQVDGIDIKGTPFFGNMDSGRTAWWKFDEETGAVAYDSSGNNRNGNLLPSCPNCPEHTSGKYKNALRFDGTNDYVNANAQQNALGSGSLLTISAWFKPNGIVQGGANIMRIPAVVGDNIGEGLTIAVGTISGNNRIWVGGYSGAYSAVSSPYTDNQWTHITAVHANGNIYLYKDGILVTSGVLGTINNGQYRIGTGEQNQLTWFNGVIDEVKTYNRATGDLNIQPGKSGLVVSYPAIEGRHNVRVGTTSNMAEATVTCG